MKRIICIVAFGLICLSASAQSFTTSKFKKMDEVVGQNSPIEYSDSIFYDIKEKYEVQNLNGDRIRTFVFDQGHSKYMMTESKDGNVFEYNVRLLAGRDNEKVMEFLKVTKSYCEERNIETSQNPLAPTFILGIDRKRKRAYSIGVESTNGGYTMDCKYQVMSLPEKD